MSEEAVQGPGVREGLATPSTRVVALVETHDAVERASAIGITALVRPSGSGEAVSIDGRRVYWIMPGDLPDERWLAGATASGAEALILDTAGARLLDRFTFGDLSALADACRARGIGIGFAGGLEAPDVPRLMPLRPALLAFEGIAALVDGLTGTEAIEPAASPIQAIHPDRVFIRDFVQDMEIGAYASEKGRRQRVRFSIEAELQPRTERRSIGDIYSYDRMMDAVRALTTRVPQAFVETLAEMLAEEILRDDRVRAVTIRVEKLDLGPAAAGVEIRRSQP